MPEEEKDFNLTEAEVAGLLDAFDEEKAGEEIGYALGLYDAYRQAQAAYDAAEIHLWLEYHKPKTFAEWAAWQLKWGPNEEFEKRWVMREDV